MNHNPDLLIIEIQQARRNFMRDSEPYRRELARLACSQPVAFIQNPDGSLSPLQREQVWDRSALDYAKALEGVIEIIRQQTFARLTTLKRFYQ